MPAASTTNDRPKFAFGEALAVMASRPLLVALVIIALISVSRLGDTVDSDVAWQLWIAQQVRGGASLYRDIIEVNPPLWFWMALPIDRAAAALHIRPEPVLAAAVGMFAALALAATDRLLRQITPPRRALLLGYAALCLLAMPWVHLGQREQLVLIGTLPYAALIAARRERRHVPPTLAFLIGAGAAVVFALKHYFLIVPLLLELWLLVELRRQWRWRRPETVAMVGVGAAYAAAIAIWASDYLTRIVPLVRLSYGMLRPPSVGYLFGPFALLGLVSLGLVVAHMRPAARATAPVATALTVAAIAFAAIYFIQAKGWIYHAIPLLGCASLALLALLTEAWTPMRGPLLAVPALLALPLWFASQERLHPALPGPDLRDAVSGLHPGDTVGFLSVETAIPWSITLQRGFRYPSRYMGYWMMNAIVANEGRPNSDPRLSALGRQIVADTVADFQCAPPARIVVPRPPAGQPGFDILPYFLRNAEFAAFLGHYRVRSRTGLETYELHTPIRAVTEHCRHGA